MKVLFIGGTGTISSAVSELAIKKGIDLYLFNRNIHSEFTPEGARIVRGDIRDEKAASDILKDYTFDVVVDWVAYTPEHIETDIRLFKGKTGQYVFISSASAYQKPLENFLITEKTPLVNPYWQYSRDKIACEERLFEEYNKSGFPITIIRPSHTYGCQMIPFVFNSRKSRFSVVERMRRGKKIVIPGDGTSLWVLTHNTDFAKAFVGMMGKKDAIGEAFHITSDEVLTWNQIAQTMGEAVGVTPELYHISSDFLASCIPERHAELWGDKVNSVCFDNSKIKALVSDYKATKPFREGIREVLQWYLERPELCTLDEEWDTQCDKLIWAHEAGIRAFKSL